MIVIALSLFAPGAVFCSFGDTQQVYKIKYSTIFKKRLEGEAWTGAARDQSRLTVRAFDLKRNNGKNGIAVCGKKLYIFTGRGTLLTKSNFQIFKDGASRIRIAKLSKDGYDEMLIASGDGSVRIFDRLGMQLSSLGAPGFFSKDLNGDGIDEIIIDGGAYYTKDGGFKWYPLWTNDAIRNMQDIVSSENGNGFCYNRYLGEVTAVDKNGKILFRTKPISKIRCLAVGDFNGDGVEDEVAAPCQSGPTYIFDKAGNIITFVEMKISGEDVDLNEVMTIKAARLYKDSGPDDIVIGGRRGLVAFNARGDILWNYIKWSGGNREPAVYNMFIVDLDGDGNLEVVAGKGNEIFIFSGNGRMLDKITVDGDLSSWQHPNAKMDIADVNGDGSQEILAVTSEGYFYIFGLDVRDGNN